MFPQQQSNADTATLTTLLDVAAVVETDLSNTKATVRALQHDLQQVRQRQEWTQRGILAIRRSHRSGSHFATSRLIKQVLVNFESGQPRLVRPRG